jgi:hypothetical protein
VNHKSKKKGHLENLKIKKKGTFSRCPFSLLVRLKNKKKGHLENLRIKKKGHFLEVSFFVACEA